MAKKLIGWILLVLAGLMLVLVGGFVLTDESLKAITGICLGIGAASVSTGIAKIISEVILSKHPEVKRKQAIEERDERNTLIRDKAKAKGFDAMGVIFGAAMLCLVLMGADIPTVLLIVGAYLLVYAVQIYYISKYSKEL